MPVSSRQHGTRASTGWSAAALMLFCILTVCAAARDFYEVLGVSPSSDDAVIKRAYRKLAKEWHPDRNAHRKKAATKRIAEINEAYETLIDPAKRKEYDLSRADSGSENMFGGQPRGQQRPGSSSTFHRSPGGGGRTQTFVFTQDGRGGAFPGGQMPEGFDFDLGSAFNMFGSAMFGQGAPSGGRGRKAARRQRSSGGIEDLLSGFGGFGGADGFGGFGGSPAGGRPNRPGGSQSFGGTGPNRQRQGTGSQRGSGGPGRTSSTAGKSSASGNSRNGASRSSSTFQQQQGPATSRPRSASGSSPSTRPRTQSSGASRTSRSK